MGARQRAALRRSKCGACSSARAEAADAAPAGPDGVIAKDSGTTRLEERAAEASGAKLARLLPKSLRFLV